MKKLTKEQAIKIGEAELWKDLSDKQIVDLQLFQEFLCMPFGKFQEAIERVLGRPVFTHEFADSDTLQKEYLGEKQPPSFEDIINMIPPEKRIIIGL